MDFILYLIFPQITGDMSETPTRNEGICEVCYNNSFITSKECDLILVF